jgi:hypothetical protein
MAFEAWVFLAREKRKVRKTLPAKTKPSRGDRYNRNAPAGAEASSGDHYREERPPTRRMGKRNPAPRAKSSPADSGCNRLTPCLTVARVWHQEDKRLTAAVRMVDAADRNQAAFFMGLNSVVLSV